MIQKDDCILFGSIGKPHGTKGAFVLLLRNIKANEIKKRDSVFVEIDGLLVPFFIELFQPSSNDAVLVKVEDLDSESKAKSFSGLNVYVSKDKISKKKKSMDQPFELSGFSVIDVKKGFIGVVFDIADIAGNPLLIVQQGKQEILIPWHEDIILQVDQKKKEIQIEAPEGLFDL